MSNSPLQKGHLRRESIVTVCMDVQALFLVCAYQPNLRTKEWWPAVSIVGHPKCRKFQYQDESLGCDLLPQEVLGFGFFVFPLLQLLGTKEADDPLSTRVAICNNLVDDVALGRVGILLDVLCDLFSCFRKRD